MCGATKKIRDDIDEPIRAGRRKFSKKNIHFERRSDHMYSLVEYLKNTSSTYISVIACLNAKPPRARTTLTVYKSELYQVGTDKLTRLECKFYTIVTLILFDKLL